MAKDNKGIDATDHVAKGGLLNRRLFLNSALATTATMATMRAAYGQEDIVGEGQADWTLIPGTDALEYGGRSRFEEANVKRFIIDYSQDFLDLRLTKYVARTPLDHMLGVMTPSGLHFERSHQGIPDIDPAQHELVIHGMVKQPLKFNIEDLENYPTVSCNYFLECSGNSGLHWRDEPTNASLKEIHGLLSGSEWTGVLLSTLLEECGVSKDAKWIVAEGADNGMMSRSIPLDKALDDTMIAIRQNGERIRPSQGYPMRLFNPGFEGNTSVKWLRSLYVSDQPAMSAKETSKYTDPMPDGKILQYSLTMDVKSVITRPSNSMSLKKKGLYEVTGLAWAGRGKIARVEVSVDGGKTWADAALEGPIQLKMLTRFRIPWMWDGSPAILQSRAIDEFGNIQPTRSELLSKRGKMAFYHYHGIQSWAVSPSGEIKNVYV